MIYEDFVKLVKIIKDSESIKEATIRAEKEKINFEQEDLVELWNEIWSKYTDR